MTINFEITTQLGFSREGNISIGGEKIKTPNLLLPQFPFRNPRSNNRDNEKQTEEVAPNKALREFRSFLSKKKTLLGYEFKDAISLLGDKKGKGIGNDELGLKTIFETSKDLLGINIHNEDNAKNENDPDLKEKIIILEDNMANTGYFRYEDYEVEALKARLEYYEKYILSQPTNCKYVLEITFCKDQKKRLDIIIEWIKEHRKQLVGIKIKDIFSNLGNFRHIIPWIMKLKLNTSANLLWIASGKIFTENFALATYLGFDIIDCSSLVLWGYKGLYITEKKSDWVRNFRHPPCNCPICSELPNKMPKRRDVRETKVFKRKILLHNLFNGYAEFNRIRNAVKIGTLRTYIESLTHNSPSFASTLRILDKQYGNHIKERFPLIEKFPMQAIGEESYNRPEVQNFINRIKNEITPAKSYKYIILLPCSAKKPYSKSRSHRSFRRVLRRAIRNNKDLKKNDVHQVILTSPLGIIPRELEGIFPVAHYDIPVTGDWDMEEINMTATCLIHWLKKYPTIESGGNGKEKENEKINPIIIAHLTGGYRKACQKAQKILTKEYTSGDDFRFIYTTNEDFEGSPSSREGLDKMQETLEEAFKKIHLPASPKTVKKKILLPSKDEIKVRAILDYQFGNPIGEEIIKNGVVLGNKRNQYFDEILMYDGAGKKIFGRVFRDTGFVKLSLTGGRMILRTMNSLDRFKKSQSNLVVLNEQKMRGTTVFRPILAEIDENARPNDEMIVVNPDGDLIGVGSLTQVARDIKTSNYGEVVELRKKT